MRGPFRTFMVTLPEQTKRYHRSVLIGCRRLSVILGRKGTLLANAPAFCSVETVTGALNLGRFDSVHGNVALQY